MWDMKGDVSNSEEIKDWLTSNENLYHLPIVTADGQLSNIDLKSQTLDDAFDEFYKVLFPKSRDVETQDIYTRRGDVAGTREGVSVFYDSAGAFQGKNKSASRAKLARCVDTFWRCGPRSLKTTPRRVMT